MDATKIIGLLIGFLVVGVIGVYVGDALISSANLSVATVSSSTITNYTHQSTAPGSGYTWTVPSGVSSLDLTIVGGGGGGGAGNVTDNKGGSAGTKGTVTTTTVAVTSGTVITIKHGAFGAGGASDGFDGAAGTNTSITIGTTLYNAAGGAKGLTSNSTNATARQSGLPGQAGWGTSGFSQAGTANKSFAGGNLSVGFGASGGGGALDKAGGRGENGGTSITYDQTTGTTSALYTSQVSVIETFQLGITLCKIIVIVSVASIIFVLLQNTGLIPAFGAGRSGPPPS